MKSLVKFLVFLLPAVFSCCSHEGNVARVTLTNTLDIDRNEVVIIPLHDLFDHHAPEENYAVTSESDTVAFQLMDGDRDGKNESLAIQARVGARSTKTFDIFIGQQPVHVKTITFARFVPERIDDFAWENDRVAFRTFGPEAQRLDDINDPAATLTSGIDCWLKRVEYPVINKWYNKHVRGGTYHQDDGEGYDPYHVGKSRGCGGIGVLLDDSLYVSKNFIKSEIIANGPIRTIFELSYAPWKVNDTMIEEKKIITIDAGTQLFKVQVILKPSSSIPNCTIGIAEHDKMGSVWMDKQKGTFSYWESIDGSEVGTGVVIDPEAILQARDFRTDKRDLSHILISAKPSDTITYYTGFAWTKAGRITSEIEWRNYLSDFSSQITSPLAVEIEK